MQIKVVSDVAGGTGTGGAAGAAATAGKRHHQPEGLHRQGLKGAGVPCNEGAARG